MNSRISDKERNLLKGAIRRVFSRSDLRKKVVELTVVSGYTDPSRPRVKKWSICQCCKQYVPTYTLQVDHKDPVVPLDSSLKDMSWDLVVDRTWCEENNLWAICLNCHKDKTKVEQKERRALKKVKEGNKDECKTNKRPKKASKKRSTRATT